MIMTQAKRGIISRVSYLNSKGIFPNKQRICREYPRQSNRTVAYRYMIVDEMIRNGVLVNHSDRGKPYQLEVTEFGLTL